MSILKKQKQLMVVFGSPNSDGNTRVLLSSFLRLFELSDDWSIVQFNAYELNAHPCTGCKACAKKEMCIFDDLDEFQKQLKKSDLLVFASPVYNFSFPSPIKAILDRMQRYFEARFSLNKNPPIKKHRDAVLLLTMGSEDEYAVDITNYQLKRIFSVMNTDLKGCVVWKSTDLGIKNRAVSMIAAGRLAENLMKEQ